MTHEYYTSVTDADSVMNCSRVCLQAAPDQPFEADKSLVVSFTPEVPYKPFLLVQHWSVWVTCPYMDGVKTTLV